MKSALTSGCTTTAAIAVARRHVGYSVMVHGGLVPDLKKFPEYFRAYNWNKKHKLFGYPEDKFDEFRWINSLENRFQWLKTNCVSEGTVSVYLLTEMIQWGGSQGGTLQKFEDGSGETNLHELMKNTISNLHNPTKAITAALKFPGMGLTYASKMLRFLEPEEYGALDRRIRDALVKRVPGVLPNIVDSSVPSMVAGYVAFTKYVNDYKSQLDAAGIVRPKCKLSVGIGSSEWRSADIEMALFEWALSDKP